MSDYVTEEQLLRYAADALAEGVDERSSPGSSSDASGATTRFAPAPSVSADPITPIIEDIFNRLDRLTEEMRQAFYPPLRSVDD